MSLQDIFNAIGDALNVVWTSQIPFEGILGAMGLLFMMWLFLRLLMWFMERIVRGVNTWIKLLNKYRRNRTWMHMVEEWKERLKNPRRLQTRLSFFFTVIPRASNLLVSSLSFSGLSTLRLNGLRPA